jgi:hypothetical protein
MDVCRRFHSPGTVDQRTKVASTGSTSTRKRTSSTRISCIGPGSIRIGILCARSAIRPACTKITMRPMIDTIRHGRRLAWAARRATVKALAMLTGHAIRRVGGRSEKMTTSPRASRCTLMSGAMSRGGKTREPATRNVILRRQFAQGSRNLWAVPCAPG